MGALGLEGAKEVTIIAASANLRGQPRSHGDDTCDGHRGKREHKGTDVTL